MQRKYLVFIVLLAMLVAFSNIGGTSIYILDEAKNATCAKEMYFRSDIVVPTFNGELRGDKPPLHYFFMMLSYSVFGVTAFAARFFSSFMGLITVLSSMWFVRRYFGQEAANWTGIGLLASMFFMLEFHLSVPDPYLIGFVLIANLCFYVSWHDQRKPFLWFGYIFLALAVLAKGPVAIVLTGLGWLLYIVLMRLPLLAVLRHFRLHLGIPLLLLIVLPWFIAVHVATDGQWTQMFFLDHNVNRFMETKEGHGGVPFLALLFTLFVMFPVSVFLPRLLWKTLRYRTHPILVFLCAMGISPVVFFIFSSTVLPNYIMPGIPFLVMASMIGLRQFLQNGQTVNNWEWGAAILISILFPVAAYFGINSEKVLHGLEWKSLWLSSLPAGILLGYILYQKKRVELSLLVSASGAILSFLFICWFVLPAIDQRNPVNQSRAIWETHTNFRYYKRINPSYVFYLPEPVGEIVDLNDPGDGTFMIFSRSDYADSLDQAGYELLFRYRNLFETRETVIFGPQGVFKSDNSVTALRRSQPWADQSGH